MKIPVGKIENFVSKDEQAKPMLRAVWFDVPGQRLLATNGHMAIRASIEPGADDVSGLVPVEAFALARQELRIISRAMDKNSIPDVWLNVVCNPDAIFIQNLMSNTTHLVVRPKLAVDEHFPGVDAAIPRVNQGPSVTLSMDYLLEITKSLQLEGASLSLWVSADDRAVVVGSPLGKCVVALMPMKVEVDPEEVNRRGAPVIPFAKSIITPEFAQKVQDEMHAAGFTDCTVTAGSDIPSVLDAENEDTKVGL
jgi:hypothetical protein